MLASMLPPSTSVAANGFGPTVTFSENEKRYAQPKSSGLVFYFSLVLERVCYLTLESMSISFN